MISDSVLPPPPRYPIASASTSVNATGQPVTNTTMEMVNVIENPTGPEYQLSVGEGTYVLKDSLHLATPPPHPQDAPIVSSNPLATTPTPPRVGVKVSICIMSPARHPPTLWRSMTGASTKSFSVPQDTRVLEKEQSASHETGDPLRNQAGSKIYNDETHPLTQSQSKEGLKRRKPKTNLIKSNSQFISRVIPHDQLQKRLQEHKPEDLFIFANIDRAYQWLDTSGESKTRAQPLMKILFSRANVLCHDVNHFTKTTNHIDVLLGTNTGDIVWFEAYSQKYVRINKGNVISSAPVTEIRWLPGSESIFLASHMDGTLIVYDKERDDAAFVPEIQNGDSNGDTDTADHHNHNHHGAPLHINKSVNSKNQKSNPVASWKLSNHCIEAFAFSPESRPNYLAVVSEDGSFRIINYMKEQLVDLYPSYYGAFTCVCWSPDGKYVLTGGQDDLVSIWSLAERRIVARCHGHCSWVTAVAFDPWRSCDGRNYRFGSVGEDRRLLLWDFNVGMLRRPRATASHTSGQRRDRGSISSAAPHHQQQSSISSVPAASSIYNRPTLHSHSTTTLTVGEDGMNIPGEEELIEHEVESRTTTAELPPVMSKIVDEHRMSNLAFEQDCIITACTEGHVRFWLRPEVASHHLAQRPPEDSSSGTQAAALPGDVLDGTAGGGGGGKSSGSFDSARRMQDGGEGRASQS